MPHPVQQQLYTNRQFALEDSTGAPVRPDYSIPGPNSKGTYPCDVKALCGGNPNELNYQLYLNATQNRQNYHAPDLFLYSGRDVVPTTTVPMPGDNGGSAGWAQQVDIESNLRNFQNRDTSGGCNDLRSLYLPLSWTMDYLPSGWQQDDDFARHMIFTRQLIADTCRPLPYDKSSYYNTRNCVDTNDCNPRLSQKAVYQHRLAYP